MIEVVALDAQIVGEAGDGDEAVSMARQLSPDLILMDFQMPGLDGAAAALAIKVPAGRTRRAAVGDR